MKIAKWFFLTACALLCGACSKNDPLAYVTKDADIVLYFNTTEELSDNQKELLERETKLFRRIPLYDHQKKEWLGNNLFDMPAKMAFWAKIDKDAITKDFRGVIVFKDDEAEDFMDNCKKAWKKKNGDNEEKYITDKVTIDDCEALLLKEKIDSSETGEKEEKLIITILAADDHIIQIFFGDDKPREPLKAEGKSELAENIKSKYIVGMANSGELLTHIRELGEKDKKSLKFGNLFVGSYFSGDELITEGSMDISKIVK